MKSCELSGADGDIIHLRQHSNNGLQNHCNYGIFPQMLEILCFSHYWGRAMMRRRLAESIVFHEGLVRQPRQILRTQ